MMSTIDLHKFCRRSQPQPFHQQHIADSQQDGTHEQAKEPIGQHSAYDFNHDD